MFCVPPATRVWLQAMVLLLLMPAAALANTPPPVRFQAESRAGRLVADECRTIWQEVGPELSARLLPVTVVADTVLCLVLDTPSFQRHFGNRLPDWGVGVAVGHGRLIALDHSRLPAVGRGAREVFLHEMVHALLFQGTRGQWLPTWLHEGAAMHYGGEWRFADTVSLILAGRVPDLLLRGDRAVGIQEQDPDRAAVGPATVRARARCQIAHAVAIDVTEPGQR